jgi:uncharacterized protein (DUF1697 family)
MSTQRLPPEDDRLREERAAIAAEDAHKEIAREAAKHAVQLIKEQIAREDVERIANETATRIVQQAFKDVGIKLSNGGLDESKANWTWTTKRRKMEEEITSQALKAVGMGLVAGLITIIVFYIRGNQL